MDVQKTATQLGKQIGKALGDAGTKVSSIKEFFVSNGRWLATGLSVVLATLGLDALIKQFPLLSKYANTTKVVGSIVLMASAGLLAIPKFTVTRFIATGLGLTGAIALLGILVTKLVSFAVQQFKKIKAAIGA